MTRTRVTRMLKYLPVGVVVALLDKAISLLVLLTIGYGLSVSVAAAAEFSVRLGDAETPALVQVEGEFLKGDDEIFVQRVVSLKSAVVVFASPGGNLVAGLEIGKAVRLKNFSTYVPAETFCSSACALAWVGGTRRFMSKTAKIGFHAAYNTNSGSAQESGIANALVGAYLNSLGLPETAIAYMTVASPNSMMWLTATDAQQLGLNVSLFDLDDPPAMPTPPPVVPERANPPPADSSSVAKYMEKTRSVQKCLKGFRFYLGPLNGELDSETSYSIQKFQNLWGMRVTGTITYELLAKCGLPVQ